MGTALSDLNGLNGIVIHSDIADSRLGISVSSAGDINGDGIDDFMVGAHGAFFASGISYVVFGSSLALPSPLNLMSINSSNGLILYGENVGDISGSSISSAGVINADGIDDLIIGASGLLSKKSVKISHLPGSDYRPSKHNDCDQPFHSTTAR